MPCHEEAIELKTGDAQSVEATLVSPGRRLPGVLFVDAYSNTLDLAEDRTPRYAWMPVEYTGDPEMVTAFIEAVRNDTEPQVTGEDGLRALQVALCAYESAKRQEPVPVVTAP